MIDYIEKAKAFAMMAHKGQTDKAGEDYFTAHVAVVADGVEPDPLVKAAAYLHDTVEDTGTTIDTIRAEFPQEVAEAVSVLTREKDMTYAEYIWRVKQNDIAVKVKRADLRESEIKQVARLIKDEKLRNRVLTLMRSHRRIVSAPEKENRNIREVASAQMLSQE